MAHSFEHRLVCLTLKKTWWLITCRFCMQLIFLAKEEIFDTFDKRVWRNRTEGKACLSFIQRTAQEGHQCDVLFGDSESAFPLFVPLECGKSSFTQDLKKKRKTNCYGIPEGWGFFAEQRWLAEPTHSVLHFHSPAKFEPARAQASLQRKKKWRKKERREAVKNQFGAWTQRKKE